jgi:hypothetical protein
MSIKVEVGVLSTAVRKKRFFLSLFVFVVLYSLFFLLYSSSALAASDTLSPPPGSINPDINISKVPQLVINWLFAIATFLALAYLMYGGIKYITSRGDKVAVDSARKHLMAAVVGLVIVLGAFFALNVVFKILGANNPLENTDNLFLEKTK